jgi:hypothetical protein
MPQIVRAAYKCGYDELNIEYEGKHELEHIHEMVRMSFNGFEIISESAGQVTIRKVSELANEGFHILFRRMFHILLSTAQDGLVAAKADDKEECLRLAQRERLVSKLANFCERIVSSQAQTEYKQDCSLFCLLEQLEKIGEEYRRLNTIIGTCETKPSKFVLDYYEQVNKSLREHYELFFDFDLQKMDAIVRKESGVVQWKSEDLAPMLCLNDIFRRLHDLSNPMIALHL